MSIESFEAFYERQNAAAMLAYLDRQEDEEANIRGKRTEIAERFGLQHTIAKWLAPSLGRSKATHLMLGSSGMRTIEAISLTAKHDINVVVAEENLTSLHDAIHDFTGTPDTEQSYAVFVHLFGEMQYEHGRIQRVFAHHQPTISSMRKRRARHKSKHPHVFMIADTPSGEAIGAMFEDARADSGSYDGTTIGAQRLIFDPEAGEALADYVNSADSAHGKQAQTAKAQVHEEIGKWYRQRAAYAAFTHLKDEAPFIVHGSAHVPANIDNRAALAHLSATTLHGIRHLWTVRRQIAIRILDGRSVTDPFGNNLLYALELLRVSDAHAEENKENERCSGT